MTESEARRNASQPTDGSGTDGMLAIRKGAARVPHEEDAADPLTGGVLRWPKCLCGSPKCPDYRPPAPAPERESKQRSDATGELRARLAERNRRSSRGGT